MSNLKPAAAIFILVMMVMSVVAYAMAGANISPATDAPTIPTVIREPLSTESEMQILRTGRVLIQHFYTEDCTDCLEKNVLLESFAARMEGYVVINEVLAVDSKLEMIGWDQTDPTRGKIIDISNNSLEYDDMIGQFCDVAIMQPRVCLLRDV